MRKMKLVLVEWVDSHAGNEGWQRLSEIKEQNGPMPCSSVGWLVADANGHKTIVPHLSGVEEQFVPYGRGELTIPNSAITKLRVLQQK